MTLTLTLLSAKNDKELPDKGIVTRAVHAELIKWNIEMTEDDWTLKLRPKVHDTCTCPRIHMVVVVQGRGVRECVSKRQTSQQSNPGQKLKAFMDDTKTSFSGHWGNR